MSQVSAEHDPTSGNEFMFDTWHAGLVQTTTHVVDVKPFAHVYAFVKHNQAMTRHDLKEMSEAIHDILNAKGVNYGILMFMQGTYVFTEVPVDLNPLMIKLSTGINFNGEVTSIIANLSDLNKQLGR